MSGGFEDRKKGFENKWAHDEELRFKVFARRNKLLGLWAAEQAGVSGADADAYAREVVQADFAKKRTLPTAGSTAAGPFSPVQ